MSLRITFLLFTLIIAISLPALARPYATFYKLPTDDSIKHTNTFTVFQDSKGIVWAATTNGLARYNSNTVKIYRNNPDNKHSLPTNVIRDIAEGQENTLWLATINGGLVSFDPEKEIFTQYIDKIDPQLWSIQVSNEGRTLWLGSLRNGLSRFNTITKSVTKYNLHYADGQPLSRITDIYPLDNSLLLATDRGLYRFDIDNQKITPALNPALTGNVWDIKNIAKKSVWVAADNGLFTIDGNVPALKGYTGLRSIETDNRGNIYIATKNSGLISIQDTTKEIKILEHSIFNDASLPNNLIWDIEVTDDNMVFVATKAGVSVFNPQALNYTYYDRLWADKASSEHLLANSVFVDSNNILWIGTNSGPLSYSLNNSSKYDLKHWKLDNSVPFDFIEDKLGNIWIAELNSRGLMVVNPAKDQELKHVNAENSECCNSLNSLLLNEDGSLWVGINGNGIARYQPKKTTYSAFNMQNIQVSVISRFDKDKLLVGSYGGAYLFNTTTGNYKLLSSTKNHFIFDILHTQSGIIYIGTDKGLLKIIENEDGTLSTEAVNAFKGGNRVIFSILEAENGDLWLGTGLALARYRPSTGKAYVLTQEQGVPMAGFFRNSAAKSKKESTLFFGGPTGVIAFDPLTIEIDNTIPQVFITDMSAKLPHKERTYKPKNNIAIPHAVKTLTIDFYALDYRSPETPTHYAYLLEGFNKEISYTHADNVSFTNLDPGVYTFKIKAANNFGEWGDTFTELEFTIITPWWMTGWAYILYAALAIAILIIIFWYQHKRLIKERNISMQLREAENLREHFVQELEGQISEATGDLRDSMEALQIKTVELEVANKRAQESTQLKSHFLANISHELRTPLNGILGFTNLLNKTKLESNQHEYISTIRQSGEALMDIINNVLDISKIEAGKITLDINAFNLRECIESTLSLLAPIAYEKKLELCCIIEPELPMQLRGDTARLRQILTNLLGNAIKFTQSGTVSVRVLEDSTASNKATDDKVNLIIAISDTGIGIAPDHMERLFTSFNQATPGIERRFGGTGLGLSLSKMLTEAMGGTISLQSTPNVGTTAKVELCLNRDNSAPDWEIDTKLAGNTVLLYDEHPLSTQSLMFMLQSWGLQVVETKNHKEWQEELARHARHPRYAAFIITLNAQQLDKARSTVKRLLGKQDHLPALLLASTLDLNILYKLETAIAMPCLAKHAGSQIIHNTLLTLLDDQPQFSRTARKISAKTVLAGLRILIADDNSANRDLLRHMLRQNGAYTAEAEDGREALERICNVQNNKADSTEAHNNSDNKKWDLLLLDIHMPNVSGLEVIARIREGKAGSTTLPVIAVTANAMPEMRQWATACGMDGYIIKPFTEEKLLEEIQRVLPN